MAAKKIPDVLGERMRGSLLRSALATRQSEAFQLELQRKAAGREPNDVVPGTEATYKERVDELEAEQSRLVEAEPDLAEALRTEA